MLVISPFALPLTHCNCVKDGIEGARVPHPSERAHLCFRCSLQKGFTLVSASCVQPAGVAALMLTTRVAGDLGGPTKCTLQPHFWQLSYPPAPRRPLLLCSSWQEAWPDPPGAI